MRQETEKVTIRVFRGDKEKLSQMFPGLGYNKAMRHIVHNFIKGVEEKAMRQQSSSGLPTGTINIDEVIEEAAKDEQ